MSEIERLGCGLKVLTAARRRAEVFVGFSRIEQRFGERSAVGPTSQPPPTFLALA
jgi:hypothetical protein